VIFVTRLPEHRLDHFRDAFNGYPDRSPLYPEHAQWVPQYVLERVVRGGSLYNLFGPGFSLIVDAAAAEQQVTTAERDARAAHAPLTVVRPIGVPVRELYGTDFALVRSDHHLAWRGEVWHPAVLNHVMGRGR
jgi:hypothetical protein